MAYHSHFLCMGHMVCQADFLHAGQVAMYTPTILHVSCMAKIDNIHEQCLLANRATYLLVLFPHRLFPFLFVVEKGSLGTRLPTYNYIVYNVYK